MGARKSLVIFGGLMSDKLSDKLQFVAKSLNLSSLRQTKVCRTTIAFILCISCLGLAMQNNERPRARDIGLAIGVIPPGPLNAITDVSGVRVGHTTIRRAENIRTGVTAILPHSGNLFREKVPGAVFIGNAFGKLAGSTQVNELGEIETPIVLTSTL